MQIKLVGQRRCDTSLMLASFIQHLQDEPTKSETYHLSDFLNVSWTEFESDICTNFMVSNYYINHNSQYAILAKRSHTRMDQLTKNIFGIEQLDWREGLKAIPKELGVTP